MPDAFGLTNEEPCHAPIFWPKSTRKRTHLRQTLRECLLAVLKNVFKLNAPDQKERMLQFWSVHYIHSKIYRIVSPRPESCSPQVVPVLRYDRPMTGIKKRLSNGSGIWLFVALTACAISWTLEYRFSRATRQKTSSGGILCTTKRKSAIYKLRMLWLILTIIGGTFVAGLLGENSPWLLLLASAITIFSLGTSNLFQANKALHYKERTLLVAAYASAVMFGVSLIQITAWLPDPVWAR